MEEAVASAANCFRRTLRTMPAHQRSAILGGAEAGAALANQRAAELADTISREGGKPIRFARGGARRVSEILRFAAEEACRLCRGPQAVGGDPADGAAGSGGRAYTGRFRR